MTLRKLAWGSGNNGGGVWTTADGRFVLYRLLAEPARSAALRQGAWAIDGRDNAGKALLCAMGLRKADRADGQVVFPTRKAALAALLLVAYPEATGSA